MNKLWQRIPPVAQVVVLLISVPTVVVLARIALQAYLPRTVTLLIIVVLMAICSLMLMVRRNRKSVAVDQRLKESDEQIKDLSLAVMIFLSGIMAVGTVLFLFVCFNPGQKDPAMQFIFRLVSGIIAFVCFLLAIICLTQVVALVSKSKKKRKNTIS